MLRSVFRGKPIGSLRPRSSGDYGLREEWRASRVLDGDLSRRRVRRFAPSALSVGIEMHLALCAFWTAVVVPFWGCGRLFVLVNCERFVNGLVGGWLLSVSGVSFLRFI